MKDVHYFVNYSLVISAYRTRIQLALLDHNAHLDCNPKVHSEHQKYQYHRRYQKQTHNWDVDKVLQAKEYKYIPELLNEIFSYWEHSNFNMRSCITVSLDNPTQPLHVFNHQVLPQLSTKRSLDFNNNNDFINIL